MPDYGLSSQQLAVICALSCGANMTAAAEQAGVHRNTIANWRRNSLPFQQGLASAQYDKALYFREKVEDQVDLAINSIREILVNPQASPSLKLRAALAIITTAVTPPAPKKQIELEIQKVVVQPAQHNAQPHSSEAADSIPSIVHKNPQPAARSDTPETADPSIVHNNAQPVTPSDTPEAADPEPSAVHEIAQPLGPRSIARNAKCPCHSGKKYKRCCLNSADNHTFAEAA